MDIQLVPEAILAMRDNEVRDRLRTLDNRYSVDIEDPLYGAAFRYYLVFTHWPSLLGAAGEMASEEAFYNRYYWFLKFVKLHTRKHGYDAGLEQQVFQLCEHPGCDVDWSVVQEIDDQIEKELQAKNW